MHLTPTTMASYNDYRHSKAILQVVKLTQYAFLPTRDTEMSVGYDLKSAYDYIVSGRGKAIVHTDIAIKLPTGTYGRLAPRSSIAAKNHIDIGAGVIDMDYTGMIKIVVFNHSLEEFEIKRGDRICQLICEKCEYPELVEVTALSDTRRGIGGFGSTDYNRK